ncbi:TonB-dependent receptor family protein [Aquabacterium sp. OR-4]|uniref:TonB-dependent receptor family protein n=1 Tax=Aquabacterium sp. OR-4 TaxID=2978127 RepID=UPI0021B2D029|nr:TonB-dependent receptor [Aquabacterium sp. OR-4]MDT7835758.1 TonB-dependent receptor [Aquabacterium sp. OR-4]
MISLRFRLAPVALACGLAGLPTAVLAQAAGDAVADTVVITGSPRVQRLLDTPYAITAVDAAALRDAGPMINLSEALARVPGLVVNNRSNYAQDLQMSSRGFGARAAFGVRGLRLYTDGIPATMPDGQGQVAHFDLSGAERIEVLRGPFSVLYGNSSGGVVAVFSAPVRAAQSEVGVDLGSFGLHQLRLGLATPLGSGFDLRASITRAELDGFRPQSAADRQLANVRLGWRGERDSVVLLVSNHDQRAQDPLGLSPGQFALDARSTTPQALEYNTRKTIRQTQLGVNWRHAFAEGGVLRASSLTAYAGSRGVTGWQAIPASVQTSATHGGGVVDFDRTYQGLDAKLEWQLGGGDLVTGVTAEGQRDDRRGHRNYTGPATAPTAKGVVGEQRRKEVNHADSREAYAQLLWPLGTSLAFTGGLRSGEVTMRTDDEFLANGNDSGELRYRYTNPVAGLRWTLMPGWALHASAARGFESPTLGELAYAPSTQTGGGFNRQLAGQTSRQFELGSKWLGAAASAELALFSASTDNEIGVLSNTGGRSVFQNVGATRRHGAELSGAWRVMPGLRLQASASWLEAEYRHSIGSAVAGNRISGTVGASAWAEAAWRPGLLPGELALEWRAMGRMAANDANTVYAPGHALAHLRWSHSLALGPTDALELLARVDNLFDRRYVGSVIVNDGNGRFFEPGVPRALLLSARWQHRW